MATPFDSDVEAYFSLSKNALFKAIEGVFKADIQKQWRVSGLLVDSQGNYTVRLNKRDRFDAADFEREFSERKEK